MSSMMAFQSLGVFGNFYLTFWTEDDTLKNLNLSNTKEYTDRNVYYLSIYGLLGLLQGRY